MKTLRPNLAAALVGAAALLYAQIAAAPLAQAPSGWGRAPQYVQGEVLVKFRSATVAQASVARVAAMGHAVLAHLGQTGWIHIRVGAGQSMTDALAAYGSDPGVEAVQPNYIYRASALPNDTQYGQLWAFKNTGQTVTTGTYTPKTGTADDDMNIERAWDHITDCSAVVVAVIDSGVNYNQQDLASNMWNGSAAGFPNHGFDFVDNDNDPMDLAGHGTHVAGIVGARGDNATGTTGVCWTASIMAVRVLDAQGAGTSAHIIQGIDFAVAHAAKVINLSLGGPIFDQAFSNAITSAQNSDVVVVVAAGNDGINNDITPAYPCNFNQPNLVCVAALDQNYALATFSNFGLTSVDVGAPGTNILSTWAGAQATITDDFNTLGALDWTTSGGGWAYVKPSTVDFLVNPSTFPSGTYANSANNVAYKTFNLSGKDTATLNVTANVNIQLFDSLDVNYKSTGGDPFVGGVLLQGGDGSTGGFLDFSFDLTPCIGATCSVGVRLQSDPITAPAGSGAAFAFFSIDTLQLNTTTYNTINGTSMATPMVTGLAAMLRAYNPSFTYVDTVNAIKNGGRFTPPLAGKTTSGKAVDAMSTLAYINPPTGLSATLQ